MQNSRYLCLKVSIEAKIQKNVENTFHFPTKTMATSDFASKIFECPVCLDIFNDPVILNGCGHSLCKPCLEKLQNSGQWHKLVCPQCQAVSRCKFGLSNVPTF